jgi:hypothetical protein
MAWLYDPTGAGASAIWIAFLLILSQMNLLRFVLCKETTKRRNENIVN